MSRNKEFSKEIVDAYENRQYFCEYMGGWELSKRKSLYPKYAHAVKLARKYCHPIRRILDIGCGRGELVNYYCSQGVEAIGIDYSRTACEIASECLARNPQAKLGTILNIRDNVIDRPDGYFDVAFMLDLVEHLYESQLDEYYSQLRRLLREGGVLIVHTWPNRLQREVMRRYELFVRKMFNLPYRLLYGQSMKQKLRDSCEELVHVNEHTPDQLRSKLEEHGFSMRIFTSVYAGGLPNLSSELFAELVLNIGPLGFLPWFKKYLNRYIWAVAINR